MAAVTPEDVHVDVTPAVTPATEQAKDAPRVTTAEAQARSRKALQCHRRLWRTTCFITLLGLYYGVWVLSTLGNQRWHLTKTYDPVQGVSLSISACDVLVRAGTQATIKYSARGNVHQTSWTYTSNGALVREGRLENRLESCLSVPYRDCSQLCLVTIEAPPTLSGAIRIEQPPSDQSFPRIRIASGVSLPSLQLQGAAYSPLPTASLLVAEGAQVLTLFADLVSGDVRSSGGALSSVNIRIRGSGSIYLLGLPAPLTHVPLTYRQPSQRLCIGTDLPRERAAFDSAPAFSNCDAEGLIAPSELDAAGRLHKLTRTTFDRNGNGRVDRPEVRGCHTRPPGHEAARENRAALLRDPFTSPSDQCSDPTHTAIRRHLPFCLDPARPDSGSTAPAVQRGDGRAHLLRRIRSFCLHLRF